MSTSNDDIVPILPDEVDRRPSVTPNKFRRRSSIFGTIQIHKRRWWILFVFGGLGFMQCTVWNTWGPITGSVKVAYDWSDATIALLSMWGTITLMVGLFPFTILLQRKGLRVSMILTSFMMAAGTALRCVTIDKTVFTYIAHIAASQIYISSVAGASFNYAVSPLFFELAVELVYPVQQGVVGGVLTMCHNSISASFLLVMQFGLKSVVWMDYLLAGQGAVVVLFMFVLKAQYNRSSMDRQFNKEKEDRDKAKLNAQANVNYGSIEP
ncbi:unnamed protein product [Meganyctiphanes norvegica]|uniref:Uncharacterized protein n=1 Tax=Meganyctiphanes norvegica TaxID=48144 RepID=A0AAV2QF10_MEGNR